MREDAISKRARLAIKLHKNVPGDWYDRSIKENIFQRYWHRKRFKELQKFTKNLKGKALDIGCCDGTFTNYIIDHSKLSHITGIDILERSLQYAKNKYKNNKKLFFTFGEAHKLKFKNKSFDVVFCLETLEHVENPAIVLKEIKRVLKPQGKIIILIPVEKNILFKIIWSLWKNWRGKIWKNTHIHEYAEEDAAELMKKQSMFIEYEHSFLFSMLKIIVAKKKN